MTEINGIKLNFSYGKDYDIDSNKRSISPKIRATSKEETYYSDLLKKDKQISEMEDKQKLLINKNIILEDDVFRLQALVGKLTAMSYQSHPLSSRTNKSTTNIHHNNPMKLMKNSILDKGTCKTYRTNTSKRSNQSAMKNYYKKSIKYNKKVSKATGITSFDLDDQFSKTGSKVNINESIISNIKKTTPKHNHLYKKYPLYKAPSKSIISSSSLSKISTLNSSINKFNTSKPIKNNTEKDRELYDRVSLLQEQIKVLNEEIHLNKLENQGPEFIINELNTWKQKNAILSQKSLETIYNLKQKRFNNKQEFENEIRNLSNYCNYTTTTLKDNCIKLLSQQKDKIAHYREANLKAKKKLGNINTIITKSSNIINK